MLRPVLCTVLAVLVAGSAAAQVTAVKPAELYLARGDSLHDALEPEQALEAYKTALEIGPGVVEVLWRAARSQVDVAKQIIGDRDSIRQVRDSAYTVAREFAERAVAADSLNADAHFALALALGQLSRTRGGRERIRFARDIYDATARALALNPDHDGAHHILGAWHAEVKRLSGFTRFFAKTFLGAGFMGRAHWDSAAVHLERAVATNPTYLFHRLELAEIYVDMDRYAEARDQLRAIPDLPDSDVLDPRYRETAANLLEEITDK